MVELGPFAYHSVEASGAERAAERTLVYLMSVPSCQRLAPFHTSVSLRPAALALAT